MHNKNAVNELQELSSQGWHKSSTFSTEQQMLSKTIPDIFNFIHSSISLNILEVQLSAFISFGEILWSSQPAHSQLTEIPVHKNQKARVGRVMGTYRFLKSISVRGGAVVVLAHQSMLIFPVHICTPQEHEQKQVSESFDAPSNKSINSKVRNSSDSLCNGTHFEHHAMTRNAQHSIRIHT